MLSCGIKYSTRDLFCDVVNYCASNIDMRNRIKRIKSDCERDSIFFVKLKSQTSDTVFYTVFLLGIKLRLRNDLYCVGWGVKYAAKGHGLTQLHALVQPITRRTA